MDSYTCATIEDSARTLRRRVSVSDAGVNWSATGALISGDLINDEVIDVLDWGAYVVRNANADLNGDGVINTTDGDLILANFGLRGDSVCGGSFTEPPAPRTEISVSDLVAMGLPELAGADLRDLAGDEVRGTKEGGDPAVRRAAIEVNRHAGLDDTAFVHDRKAVGHREGVLLVVQHAEHRHAGRAYEFADDVADLEA